MPSIPDTLRTTAARCPDREALVLDVAVIGVPHPDYGESILAVIVPADRIADYKAPHAVVVHAIPRNPSGKIQKHLLRAERAEADLSWAV